MTTAVELFVEAIEIIKKSDIPIKKVCFHPLDKVHVSFFALFFFLCFNGARNKFGFGLKRYVSITERFSCLFILYTEVIR